MSALSTAIASLDETIGRQIEAIPALAQTIGRLRTVPGIGSVCAIALAALMPELGHAPGASIAALIGVAPYPNDSGKHCGPRHIAGGRADARRFLYMAAMVAATQTSGVLATTYQHLIAKGTGGADPSRPKPPKGRARVSASLDGEHTRFISRPTKTVAFAHGAAMCCRV